MYRALQSQKKFYYRNTGISVLVLLIEQPFRHGLLVKTYCFFPYKDIRQAKLDIDIGFCVLRFNGCQ